MQGSVRKKGNKWYYSFEVASIDGKRKRVERAGGDTKKEALHKLRQALMEYEGTGDYRQDSTMSYADYLDYWLKNYVIVNCKKGTKEVYNREINNHIKKELGHYKLKSLSPAILQDFLNSKSINGYSKNSVSNFYGILSGSLKYAVYPCKYIKENPMTYVSMPKFVDIVDNYTDNPLKIITPDNFKKIIERFPEGSTFYIPNMIAFNTALRAGEVCALDWDDIDFEKKTLRVNKTLIYINKHYEIDTPKTKSSLRVISIGDTLISILLKHKEYQNKQRLIYGEYYHESNRICTKENGEPINTGTLRYLSRVINYELNIPFNFHSLRHTHATMLIEAGANMKSIQKRLGHAKLATTMDTYVHATKKMNNDVVDLLENINARIEL